MRIRLTFVLADTGEEVYTRWIVSTLESIIIPPKGSTVILDLSNVRYQVNEIVYVPILDDIVVYLVEIND